MSKKIQANFRLDKPVIEKLQAIAKTKDLSVTEIVDIALRSYMGLPMPIQTKPIKRKVIPTNASDLSTRELLEHLGVNPNSKNPKRDMKKALADLQNERWSYVDRNWWKRFN